MTARVFDVDADAILPGRRVGLRVRGAVRAYPSAERAVSVATG